MKTEDNLYIKILEFGYSKPEGFTEEELKINLNLKNWEQYIVDEFFRISMSNGRYMGKEIGIPPTRDTLFLPLSKTGEYQKFVLSYGANFNYIDYLDLKETRESSKEAKKLAMWSIWIAVIVGIFQIITFFL